MFKLNIFLLSLCDVLVLERRLLWGDDSKIMEKIVLNCLGVARRVDLHRGERKIVTTHRESEKWRRMKNAKSRGVVMKIV